jgi:hypothetical protein
MKAVIVIQFLLLTAIFSNPGMSQDQKHTAGISYGFQYKVTDIWVGDPYNIWIDQTSSSIFDAFYLYKLSSLFQVGGFMDFETGNFEIIGLSDQKASRIGFGPIWLGHYPDKFIQFQMGGYFGFNVAMPDYEDVGNRSGIDYGIIVGPALEYEQFGLAVHHISGYSWYPKDAEPDEFGYANTKIKVKLYYKF